MALSTWGLFFNKGKSVFYAHQSNWGAALYYHFRDFIEIYFQGEMPITERLYGGECEAILFHGAMVKVAFKERIPLRAEEAWESYRKEMYKEKALKNMNPIFIVERLRYYEIRWTGFIYREEAFQDVAHILYLQPLRDIPSDDIIREFTKSYLRDKLYQKMCATYTLVNQVFDKALHETKWS